MDFLGINIDWINDAACDEDMDLSRFYVEAGERIDVETLKLCAGCPVRRECVTHAYDVAEAGEPPLGHPGGYFGGLSPALRRELTLEEALEVEVEVPAPTAESILARRYYEARTPQVRTRAPAAPAPDRPIPTPLPAGPTTATGMKKERRVPQKRQRTPGR